MGTVLEIYGALKKLDCNNSKHEQLMFLSGSYSLSNSNA